MAKKLEGAPPSRLSNQEGSTPTPRLKSLEKEKKRNKGFRLSAHDIARLENLIERVGEATGRWISEAALIGGVLLLGERVPVDDLVQAVKDSDWE